MLGASGANVIVMVNNIRKMCEKKHLFLGVLLLLCGVRDVHSEAPVVEVTGGAIRGARHSSAAGRPYFAFRAVPYAGFTLEEFRFEPPKPVHPWSGTLACEEEGPVCAQGGVGQVQGEEDCLHLSVYTPKVPGSEVAESLPVLVWLPGGAFIVSGANAYDPTLIMDRDVVLVVPQYRLGIYGFYYAFSEAPGNYGMLDQVAALRWVQDNIGKFGGDPSRVTLAGDCAGGASALYHMISPLSQGLFHRVLAVSGTALAPWAVSRHNHRSMLILTKYLKCPRTDASAMLGCLKNLHADTLLEAQMYLLEARDLFVGNGNFAPAVQAQVVKREESQFINEPAPIAYMEGRFHEVPVLLVTSKDVGNYIVDMSLYEWMTFMKEENGKNSDEILSVIIHELGIEDGSEEEQLLRDQYFSGQFGQSDDDLEALGQLLGDALYNAGLLHTARFLNDKVSTRILRFDYEDGPHSFYLRHPDPALAPPISPGAGHCDELSYFLPSSYEPLETEKQQRVSQLMLGIMDDFVNAREPGSEWPEVTDEGLECAVVRPDGQLQQGVFMPPDRVEASEMLFKQQYKIELFRHEKEQEMKLRDEL